MPKVSIIIPAYNSAKFIEKTITSVLKQTYQDWELLIIDDSSTDSTVDLVNKFIKKNQKIKLFTIEKNSGGPALPKNVGIKNATGEYVAFLDSGDEWLPEKLSRQLLLFESSKNKKLGLVSCFVNIRNTNGKLLSKYYKNKGGYVIKHPNGNVFALTSSCIITKLSILKEVGLFDTVFKISDDADMWIKILEAGYSLDFVSEFLVNYIRHENNISSPIELYTNNNANNKIIKREFIIIFERYQDVFLKFNPMYTGLYYFYQKNYKLSRKYYIKNIFSMELTFEQIVKSLGYLVLSFSPNLEKSFKKIFFRIKYMISLLKR